MFERFLKAAEGSAEAVSRRAFFGGVGRVAAAAAAAVATAAGAQAGPRKCARSNSECSNKPVGSPCGDGSGRCTFVRGYLCACVG